MIQTPDHPLQLFNEWFREAGEREVNEPNIAALATAVKSGEPSVRMVLIKAFDENGFVFYTNLISRKAHELNENPYASLCFYWPSLDKQVRIDGEVALVRDQEADDYFASRPRDYQIGAWASKQSQSLSSLEHLRERFEKYAKEFENMPVPRPPFWSGYRLTPSKIEFWQAGSYRLHTRICYQKANANKWEKGLLYP